LATEFPRDQGLLTLGASDPGVMTDVKLAEILSNVFFNGMEQPILPRGDQM